MASVVAIAALVSQIITEGSSWMSCLTEQSTSHQHFLFVTKISLKKCLKILFIILTDKSNI